MPIICEKCHHILDGKVGPTEYKLCIHCVRLTTPGADPKKIKRLHQVEGNEAEQAVNDMISNIEAQDMRKPNELLVETRKVDGIFMTVFKTVVPSTGQEFEMGFTKGNMLSFIEDLDRAEEEYG